MTISPFWIYLWGIVDSISELFIGFAVISGIIAFFSGLISFASDDESSSNFAKKIFKWSISLLAVNALLGSFTPSSKTVALMYVVPAIVNSEAIQKDAPELYHDGVEILKLKMKSYAEELRNSNNTQKK